MHTTEGAAAQRLISRLTVVLLVETGALNRDDAIEGFRAASTQIAATVSDAALRRRLMTEIDDLVRALEACGEQPVH